MLMNNNASLNNIEKNTQMSSGATVFVLNALNGREYTVVENNSQKHVVWRKGDMLGGRQTYDGLVQSVNGGNQNMEEAMGFRIDHLRQANPLLEKASNFEIACFYFANASESDRNNLLTTINTLGIESLNSLVVDMERELTERYSTGIINLTK